MIIHNGLGMSQEKLACLRQRQDGMQDRQKEYAGTGKRKRGGIALANVDRRLKFYYGQQYGLKVRSTLGVGTMVEINLPFEIKKGEE